MVLGILVGTRVVPEIVPLGTRQLGFFVTRLAGMSQSKLSFDRRPYEKGKGKKARKKKQKGCTPGKSGFLIPGYAIEKSSRFSKETIIPGEKEKGQELRFGIRVCRTEPLVHLCLVADRLLRSRLLFWALEPPGTRTGRFSDLSRKCQGSLVHFLPPSSSILFLVSSCLDFGSYPHLICTRTPYLLLPRSIDSSGDKICLVSSFGGYLLGFRYLEVCYAEVGRCL